LTIRNVRNSADVQDLIRDILNAERQHITCVVSVPIGQDEPIFDPQEVQQQSAGFCDVWVVPTGDLTRILTASLPNMADCYGGAARVYPISMEWLTKTTKSRRIMAPSRDRVDEAMDALITEIHSLAYLSGFMATRSSSSRVASGVVKSFLSGGARAWVNLDDGTPATIAQEFTSSEISLDRVLRLGQTVTGVFDVDWRRLILEIPKSSPIELLEHFGDGTVTLGLVTEVTRQVAKIALHPEVELKLNQKDVSSNLRDVLDLFFEVGDVIRVRVFRDSQGNVALRSIDIDDDEPVAPALVLVDGGLEWLSEDDLGWLRAEDHVAEPMESFLSRIGLARDSDPMPDDTSDSQAKDISVGDREVTSPSWPTPGPGPRPALATAPIPLQGRGALETQNLTIIELRARVEGLEKQLRDANPSATRTLLSQLRVEVTDLYEKLQLSSDNLTAEKKRSRELRDQLKLARSKQVIGNDFDASRAWFTPDEKGAEAWIRHELHAAWIERISPNERGQLFLSPFVVGPKFAETLMVFTNGQKYKAFKCMVDVLVGTPELLANRKVHALREGDGAATPARLRSDGAAAFRAYIEENVASARRLHYWKLTDGTIELATVGTHDAMGA
jgi:hypothetical protein